MCLQRKTNLLVSSAQILVISLFMFLLLPAAALSNPGSTVTGVISNQGYGHIIVNEKRGTSYLIPVKLKNFSFKNS